MSTFSDRVIRKGLTTEMTFKEAHMQWGSQPFSHLVKERSMKSKQQMQKSWGENMPDGFKKQQESQCSWRAASEGESGKKRIDRDQVTQCIIGYRWDLVFHYNAMKSCLKVLIKGVTWPNLYFEELLWWLHGAQTGRGEWSSGDKGDYFNSSGEKW